MGWLYAPPLIQNRSLLGNFPQKALRRQAVRHIALHNERIRATGVVTGGHALVLALGGSTLSSTHAGVYFG